MGRLQKFMLGVLGVLVAFIAASRLGLLPRSSPSPVVEAPLVPAEPQTPPPVAPFPTNPSPEATFPAATAPPPAPVETANNSVPWEEKIDEILTGGDDAAAKAQKLAALYPKLPEGAQIEAVQHLVNLLPDDRFTATAGPLVTNALTPSSVIDVLIADTFNRPNPIKLPLLAEIVRIPEHPWRDQAKTLLELFVEHDYGDDWAAWDKAVQQWLKDNQE